MNSTNLLPIPIPIPIPISMYCSARILHQSPVTPAKLAPPSCSTPWNGSTNPTLRWRRRDFTSSSLLLLQLINLKDPPTIRADTINVKSGCAEPATPTDRAFLDISIDGEPIGRIIIGLYGDAVPAGAARFADLVSGRLGISYRRKEFAKILPSYVQHGGLRSFGVDAELVRQTGSNSSKVNSLLEEWEKQNAAATDSDCKVKNVSRSVSLIVRNPAKPPPKMKLIARGGKLVIDEEEIGSEPNGTEFAIAVRDTPELDSSALVVGRVLDGMEVVERIRGVKTVQENSSSPYFRVAKLIGDKRAVVAERGFNRPYSKVAITNCGLLGSSGVDE